jgi:hypothetical protein
MDIPYVVREDSAENRKSDTVKQDDIPEEQPDDSDQKPDHHADDHDKPGPDKCAHWHPPWKICGSVYKNSNAPVCPIQGSFFINRSRDF